MQEHDRQGVRDTVEPMVEAARASGGGAAAFSALSNERADTNAITIGPASELTFISGPLTPRVSGRVLLVASIYATDATVDEPVSVFLTRDPTASTGAPGGTLIGPTNSQTASGHVGGFVSGALTWIDSASKGVAHTWGITLFSPGGHNLTVPTFSASIVAIELPG
jgi:hypothetical protein